MEDLDHTEGINDAIIIIIIIIIIVIIIILIIDLL